MLQSDTTDDKVHIKLAKEYKELFNPQWRHIIYYGGRASGKSTGAALAVLLRGRQAKIRVLCTREFQNSLADSVHALLKDLINKYEFTDYQVLNDVIRNSATGSEIIFKGLRKHSQAIKSTEGIDLCWVEEAQTITDSSIELLVPTIRKEGSQIIWTFNRLTELDPIYTKYCINPDPNIYIAEVNSDVLERVGQLPKTILEERERDRLNNPESFGHIWLGQPVGQAEQSIIGRDTIIEAMKREVDDDGAIEVGVDVARMGKDRSVFWKRKGFKTTSTETHQQKRLTDLADELERFVGHDKDILIKIDDTGVGCITASTKVLTPDGWKRADKLCIGDTIYSKTPAGVAITAKLTNIRSKESDTITAGDYTFSWIHLLRYKTRPGYDFKLGRWTDIASKSVYFDTKFDHNVVKQDFILPEHGITMPNGGYKRVNSLVTVDAGQFARFLGWYASEGSIDHTSKCISISQAKSYNFDDIIKAMQPFGKLQVKKNGKGYDFKIFNTSLMKWLLNNCYEGGRGFKYVTVPRWLANNSKETIAEFLDAFRRGDGYIQHGRNYYCTSSIHLVDDLKELIYKTGKSCNSYLKHEAGSQFQIEGRTATRKEDNYCVFEYAKPSYGIKGMTPQTGKETVYSLTIESKTKLMFTMTPGAKPIWTHNGGLTDIMIERGYNIMAINFGGEPVNKDKYPNWISEAWFHMAEIMPVIQLPMDKDLLQELSTRQWKQDNKGKRGVEGKADYKKRGYRSPDKADACIIAYYTPPAKAFEFDFV